MRNLKLLVLALFISGCTVRNVRDELLEVTAVATTSNRLCVVEETFPEQTKGPAHFDISDRCIHVDLDRMLVVYNQWGPDAVAGLWLHEIHHARQFAFGELGAVVTDVDRKKLELAADAEAGCWLAKLNRSDYQMRKYLAEYYIPASTHGSLQQRIKAVRTGFERCSN